jgi:class 3 adenylate cyclase
MAASVEQGSEDRLKLALLAHVRQDFSAPVGAMVGYAEILVEDAPRYGLERFTPDLTKMHEASLTLQRLIDDLLAPQALAQRVGDADYEAFRGTLRHDLRTPINAVKGYGEMLLEDADGIEAEPFIHDLQKLLDAAQRLLARIDALVELADQHGAVGVTVPRFEGAARLVDALRETLQTTVREEIGWPAGTCRILVVDDHESNRDLLSRRLVREAHVVVTAESGERALRLVEEEPFDLILLDILMPGMSGYEVLERLKGDPRHRDLPVIMISALDEIDSVVRCIEAGAEDYLPKPFDPVLLRARINASLEKKRLRDREKSIMEQLRIEKERSEALLLNILPQAIVARLNLGETVIADYVTDATILFADLVGFTRLSTRLPPARVVELLNRLFTEFDRLSIKFGLEKIKTIGDAYMVAGGLLVPSADHVEAAADMALAMLDVIQKTSGLLDEPLKIRIGLHTGPVVAGIIGTHKFIYDVWGDTVNTASRMESHGTANEINVSAASYLRLRDRFILEPLGLINLAGKGPMEAYFLRGRRGD